MSQAASSAGPLPSDDEGTALVKQYILALSQGLSDQDMTSFHALLSAAIQELVAADVLHKDFLFLGFNRVDLVAIAAAEIEFDPQTRIDGDSELGPSGSFQSADTAVRFVTNNLYES